MSCTCKPSEGRLELWKNSKDTTHLLFDEVRAKPISLSCLLLSLTVRMTPRGSIATMPNLNGTVAIDGDMGL